MAILITGGTGFVGRRLLNSLSRYRETRIVCSRSPSPAQSAPQSGSLQQLHWDPLAEPLPRFGTESESLRAVINLMGEPVSGRWTAEKKNRIRESRVTGTRNLVCGLIKSGLIPEVLVSASAVGYYGDRGEEPITEACPPANDFLGEVCQAWEAEARQLAEHGTRVVNLRIGIVMGRDGGALKEMLPLFRMGLGGRLGSGRQWFPWIQLDDLVRLIEFCLEHPNAIGPINATAPRPVRNQEFTRVLASQLHRPACLPAPSFALRLALGEFAGSLLASQKVLPEKALSLGFQFEFPELAPALAAILS